jgi:hypothetical protein
VLPRVDIVRWRAVAPWADDDDVEQDLAITLALFDIFRDETLRSGLAFRGGTALHKLHLAPAARYSEDIDLVQREPGPIGPTLSRLRRVLGWIGPARPGPEVRRSPGVVRRRACRGNVKRPWAGSPRARRSAACGARARGPRLERKPPCGRTGPRAA